METFTERLNFSYTDDNTSSIKINKFHSVNFFETLCKYCADNDIDLECVTNEEFDAASEVMEDYGQSDKESGSYYFWID